MINIELWREHVEDLQGSLKLCDEIDFILSKRAKDETYTYRHYVSIDKLSLYHGITIMFRANKMEFCILDTIQKIAYNHNLEIDTNNHDQGNVIIEFKKINKDGIVNE
jgi:hypothetical protein